MFNTIQSFPLANILKFADCNFMFVIRFLIFLWRIKHAMEIIHLLTDANPIQIIVDAVINRYTSSSRYVLYVCTLFESLCNYFIHVVVDQEKMQLGLGLLVLSGDRPLISHL